jgi:hypothetical protein
VRIRRASRARLGDEPARHGGELGGRVLIDKRVFVGHVGQAKFPITTK